LAAKVRSCSSRRRTVASSVSTRVAKATRVGAGMSSGIAAGAAVASSGWRPGQSSWAKRSARKPRPAGTRSIIARCSSASSHAVRRSGDSIGTMRLTRLRSSANVWGPRIISSASSASSAISTFNVDVPV
jgi:hypothetical protein